MFLHVGSGPRCCRLALVLEEGLAKRSSNSWGTLAGYTRTIRCRTLEFGRRQSCLFVSFLLSFSFFFCLIERSSTSNHSKSSEKYSTVRGYNSNAFRCFTAHVRSNPIDDEAWIYSERSQRKRRRNRQKGPIPFLTSIHNVHVEISEVRRRTHDDFNTQKVTYIATVSL